MIIFQLHFSSVCDARKVRTSGRGLQPTGIRIGDVADFKIHTESAGEGMAEVKIIGPGGMTVPFQMKKTNGNTYEAAYHPTKEGRYVIMITYGGQEVQKSPFEVQVGPKKESSIVAFGPGLTGGVVGYPAAFVVETNGETGALGFSVAGPSQAEIECFDNGDGSALVKYHPTAPGEYAVHILCDNEDIPNSPHMAHIIPKSDFQPEFVKCFGPGLAQTGVSTNEVTDFTVDTTEAGAAPLEVKINDAFGNEIPVSQRSADGITKCQYRPMTATPHSVQVSFGNTATPKSPFRVYVSDPLDPTKVQVIGPWVDAALKPKVPIHFNVDAR